MNSTAQSRRWILGICGRTATTALALAITLVLAVFATGSAQAQTNTALGFRGQRHWCRPLIWQSHPGHRREQLRHDYRRGCLRQRNGVQGHARWNADDTLFVLFPNKLHGRRWSLLGASASRRELLRDNPPGGPTAKARSFRSRPPASSPTLYSFCSQTGCTDGRYPFAGLVRAGGNFYGTTQEGGANGRVRSLRSLQAANSPHFTVFARNRAAPTANILTQG